MGEDSFDDPWPIVVIVVVALLLFVAPKLPVMARSLGQSKRIIKSEVKEMKNDDKPDPLPRRSRAVEDTIVNHPEAMSAANHSGKPTDAPPSNRA
ncbi:MAG: Sec-independent protein translocase subunit TatA [Pseudarthrobacter sp.]